MKLIKLKFAATVLTGFPFKGNLYSDYGIKVVRGENVTEGKLRWDTIKCWNEHFDKMGYYSLKKDDVVIGMDGSKVGKNKARIQQDALPLLLAQRVACLRANENTDQVYLYYCINNSRFEDYVYRIQTGSSVPHISKDQIEEFEIPIHNLKNQIKIAKILSDLDTKIELNNKINAELEAMAKLIYDYWFVQFDFPNSKGKPYKASGGKMVWSEELKREIPEGWEVVPLKSLVTLVKGNVSPNEIDKETPYIGLEHIPRKTIVLSEWETASKVDSDKCLFEKGDILFGKIRPYFHKVGLALVSGITSTDTIVLRAKQGRLAALSLQCVFSERFVDAATNSSTGSKMPRADWNVLKDYRIALPLDSLLNKYQDLFSSAIAKIELNVLENRKLVNLRDWLLPMLMNGQVRIKETAQSKVVSEVKNKTAFKPESIYNYQSQIFALIADVSKQNRIKHGEMTIAKYSYILDKVHGILTFFDYGRHHLGPWAKEMKKVLLNKANFKIDEEGVSVVNQDLLTGNPNERQIRDAVQELASILVKYKGKERSHQTELLATVCKVVEDIQSTDLKAVRDSMKKWPIDLKGEKFKNKAEKFSEEEISATLKFIISKNWHSTLKTVNHCLIEDNNI
jgi:type I restriction enzyme S subunit